MDGAHEAAVRAHAADADATPSEHKFSYPDGTPPPRLASTPPMAKLATVVAKGIASKLDIQVFVILLCVENLFCYFTDR